MECQTCSESLSALLDGELGHTEAEPFENHLRHCAHCLQEYESLRYSHDLVDHFTTSLPEPRPVLWKRIHSEIVPQQRGRTHFAPPFKMHWLPVAATLSVLTLGVISASFFLVEPADSELELSFQRYLQERESRPVEEPQSANRNPFRVHKHDLETNPFQSE